jgi:hypothetical protein
VAPAVILVLGFSWCGSDAPGSAGAGVDSSFFSPPPFFLFFLGSKGLLCFSIRGSAD